MQVAAALRRYLDPILNDCCADAAQIAIALSGGADSMALALLARDWCAAHGKRLMAFTVDHQMRTESASEARQVHDWMVARGMAHGVLTPQADNTVRNPQERARAMRYGALIAACRAHGITHLLLAHHYDDQAETVALQQHRGTAGASRAGMALGRVEGGIALVRPLLGVHKTALVDYLHAQGQPWLEDPSNASDVYARNRLRRTATEETLRAWWDMARREGERRHDDEAERNQWFIRHAQARDGGYVLPLSAWRDLREGLRSDALSHAIRCVGGKRHRPRRHETARLEARIVNQPQGVATLGHCAMRWGGDALGIRPQAALEAAAPVNYITPETAPNPLVSRPFWWFNYPPFNPGA